MRAVDDVGARRPGGSSPSAAREVRARDGVRHRTQQLVLVLEAVVDDTQRDAGLGGDRAHGRGVDAVSARDSERCLDELLTSLGDRQRFTKVPSLERRPHRHGLSPVAEADASPVHSSMSHQ